MKIVIDIQKNVYDATKACGFVIDADVEKVGKAIVNGTILSDEHGRLIDNELIHKNQNLKNLKYGTSWQFNARTCEWKPVWSVRDEFGCFIATGDTKEECARKVKEINQCK